MKPPNPSAFSLQESPPVRYHRTGVSIDIKFGMPRHHCRYHGICGLDTDETDLRPDEKLAPGRGKGRLFIPRLEYCLICFDKNSLQATTRTLQFQREYFVLREVVPFSPELARLMGGQACLLPGRYRIMERPVTYSILFELLF